MYLDGQWDPKRPDELQLNQWGRSLLQKSQSGHLTSPSGSDEVWRGLVKSDKDWQGPMIILKSNNCQKPSRCHLTITILVLVGPSESSSEVAVRAPYVAIRARWGPTRTDEVRWRLTGFDDALEVQQLLKTVEMSPCYHDPCTCRDVAVFFRSRRQGTLRCRQGPGEILRESRRVSVDSARRLPAYSEIMNMLGQVINSRHLKTPEKVRL